MIEPSKLKDAFNKIEAENYAFRAYLKNHANEKELDEQFLKLHKELFSSYDCSKCRNCCKEYSAIFKRDELETVSAFLKMTENDFIKKYINEEFGEYQLNTKPCCFLKEDGGCEIELCKPKSCKDYPFTNNPERLSSLLSIVESTSICPVVFEIFERLKDEYKFIRRNHQMFREMRRKKQLLSGEDTIAVMDRGTNGTLACIGDEGYPYSVPVSYVYFNNKIYFHSAKAGHKIDAITKNPKVSFSVIDEDTIVSEEYTSYFRSVIAFGKARIVEGEEWVEAFKALVEKYSGDQPAKTKHKEVTECTQSLVIAIDIEHITGKEAIEYVKGK